MSYNFKVGDKVRRTGVTVEGVIQGHIYTVRHEVDGFISLEGEAIHYKAECFELVEEPKQCPIELIKVWKELQKPVEERREVEFYSETRQEWFKCVGKDLTSLYTDGIYRIKPEPQMTWEEFKQELFKLSTIRNVRVVSTKHQVIVTVEYEGIREKTFTYAEYNESEFKQSTIDLIKSKTGVI